MKRVKALRVDNRGFDMMDRRYLTQIAEFYSGGPVGGGSETIGCKSFRAERRDRGGY